MTSHGACGACALALLCAAALAACVHADKRAELSPAPFVLGSRYGRSPPRLLAPRNDRFFMGSRYGKRSELEPEPLRLEAGARGAARPLLCDYTGLGALYRCRPAQVRSLAEDKRSNEEPSASEED